MFCVCYLFACPCYFAYILANSHSTCFTVHVGPVNLYVLQLNLQIISVLLVSLRLTAESLPLCARWKVSAQRWTCPPSPPQPLLSCPDKCQWKGRGPSAAPVAQWLHNSLPLWHKSTVHCLYQGHGVKRRSYNWVLTWPFMWPGAGQLYNLMVWRKLILNCWLFGQMNASDLLKMAFKLFFDQTFNMKVEL